MARWIADSISCFISFHFPHIRRQNTQQTHIHSSLRLTLIQTLPLSHNHSLKFGFCLISYVPFNLAVPTASGKTPYPEIINGLNWINSCSRHWILHLTYSRRQINLSKWALSLYCCGRLCNKNLKLYLLQLYLGGIRTLTTVLTMSRMYLMDLAGMWFLTGTFSSPFLRTTLLDLVFRPCWRLGVTVKI